MRGSHPNSRLRFFLVASGVDWVRKGAADVAHLNPVDPSMKDLIGNLMSGGGSGPRLSAMRQGAWV